MRRLPQFQACRPLGRRTLRCRRSRRLWTARRRLGELAIDTPIQLFGCLSRFASKEYIKLYDSFELGTSFLVGLDKKQMEGNHFGDPRSLTRTQLSSLAELSPNLEGRRFPLRNK